jgi:hypothetical protein
MEVMVEVAEKWRDGSDTKCYEPTYIITQQYRSQGFEVQIRDTNNSEKGDQRGRENLG